MAILFNSLFFRFKISFLPNYCVKYFDCIEKWCSGVVRIVGYCLNFKFTCINVIPYKMYFQAVLHQATVDSRIPSNGVCIYLYLST